MLGRLFGKRRLVAAVKSAIEKRVFIAATRGLEERRTFGQGISALFTATRDEKKRTKDGAGQRERAMVELAEQMNVMCSYEGIHNRRFSLSASPGQEGALGTGLSSANCPSDPRFPNRAHASAHWDASDGGLLQATAARASHYHILIMSASHCTLCTFRPYDQTSHSTPPILYCTTLPIPPIPPLHHPPYPPNHTHQPHTTSTTSTL